MSEPDFLNLRANSITLLTVLAMTGTSSGSWVSSKESRATLRTRGEVLLRMSRDEYLNRLERSHWRNNSLVSSLSRGLVQLKAR